MCVCVCVCMTDVKSKLCNTHTHTHTDITQGSTYTGCGLYIVMEQLADRHQTYIGDGNNMLRHTCGVKVMVGGGGGGSARGGAAV